MARSKTKTNAVRIIEAKKIPYQVYEYEAPDGFLDGVSVARATGMPVEHVFKTLVLQGHSKEYYVCVIPVAEELNLKKAAKHFGEKKIEMIPARDITKVTGYIKGGCSPVGMKKQFKTAVDESAAAQDTIIVSAGKVGLQMEVPLKPLLEITGAQLKNLTD
ncbi:Cys-tRNA(Pro) deacylase [Ihubacter massiliensis]|uniref:Cys-tRNA(Pro)/Cys-tRNA(Cys) deacylase n=1 Tax=Hominibacterium faecale TaxID=2839743 RepID=A0A9J6QIQ7_9FIRM|nr:MULTISPECIES: Cys-tRNA(Pro) deacylase [Eubacteriales Family XIII. Incertae Sedis]MCO7123116.1 Cys-tRNA(Pro) deacylase [Ihubacter massiliensis]MCU7377376.1 Cys-tRNA(Pro) deacylase [Hominibacterium faecale]MDE8733252.1 Cys-tRNA(Pro) deacylase [Eubacteriales bacterium DFI.9.88]